MPKGNRTNHPSRAGIKLTPHKGGKTEHVFIVTTPETKERFQKLLAKRGLSMTDWLKCTVDAEYENSCQ